MRRCANGMTGVGRERFLVVPPRNDKESELSRMAKVLPNLGDLLCHIIAVAPA
jgi:hypothetical protein